MKTAARHKPAIVFICLLACLLVFIHSPAWSQERVVIRAWDHADYGRIVFDWPTPVEYAVQLEGTQLVVTFNRAMTGNLSVVAAALPAYVKTARLAPDKKQAVMSLTQDFEYHSFVYERSVVIDVSQRREPRPLSQGGDPGPEAQTTQAGPGRTEETKGATPGQGPRARPRLSEKPQPPTQTGTPAKRIQVRGGDHPEFSRIVFDWPTIIPYTAEKTGTQIQVDFQEPGDLDMGKINRKPPLRLEKMTSRIDGKTTRVTLDTKGQSRLRHFRSGNKVVVDILSQTAKAPAPNTGKTGTQRPKKAEKKIQNKTTGKTPKKTDSPKTKNTLSVAQSIETENSFVLQLNTPPGTLAVAYQRNGYSWVGFDRPLDSGAESIHKTGTPFLNAVMFLSDPRLTLLRLDTPKGISPQLLRGEAGWMIELARKPLSPQIPVLPRLHINTSQANTSQTGEKDQSATIFIPQVGKKKVIRITDPIMGDTLVLIMSEKAGQGVGNNRTYIQLGLLKTAQGVVIMPRTPSLRVATNPRGVTIGVEGTLYVSRPLRADEDTQDTTHITPVLTPTTWREGPSPDFAKSEKILLGRIIKTPAEQRSIPRLRLAEYYFAHRLYREASGLLRYIAETDLATLNDPYYLLLAGVSHYLNGAYGQAKQYLTRAVLDDQPEVNLWRAALATKEKDWEPAAQGFKTGANIITMYGDNDFAETLSISAAEAALQIGQPGRAQSYLNPILESSTWHPQREYASYLWARAVAESGDIRAAANMWRQLSQSKNRRIRTLAQTALTDLKLARNEISLAEAINAYENLSFAWRGDETEMARMNRLAELYKAANNPRSYLKTLKDIVTNFPKSADVEDITRRMSAAFVNALAGDNAKTIDPIVALGIFREFRELTPAGADGDRLIENVVDHMIAVDLLDSAIELLQAQVEFRDTGEKRSRSGLKLARLNMLNANPEGALHALDMSDTREINPNLARERNYARVLALGASKQQEKAIDLLSGDTSVEAESIRAQIYWQSRQWQQAATAIGNMATQIRRGDINTESTNGADKDIESQTVLRWAVALALSNNKAGLNFLHQNYDDLMRTTPYSNDFRLIVTEPLHASKTMQAIARQINQIGQYQAFLASYQQRLKSSDVAIN